MQALRAPAGAAKDVALRVATVVAHQAEKFGPLRAGLRKVIGKLAADGVVHSRHNLLIDVVVHVLPLN